MYHSPRLHDIARGAQPFVVESRQIVLGVGQALLGRAMVPTGSRRMILGDAEPAVVGDAKLVLGLGQAAPSGGFEKLDLVLIGLGLEHARALQTRQCEPGKVDPAQCRSAVPARRLLGIRFHA